MQKYFWLKLNLVPQVVESVNYFWFKKKKTHQFGLKDDIFTPLFMFGTFSSCSVVQTELKSTNFWTEPRTDVKLPKKYSFGFLEDVSCCQLLITAVQTDFHGSPKSQQKGLKTFIGSFQTRLSVVFCPLCMWNSLLLNPPTKLLYPQSYVIVLKCTCAVSLKIKTSGKNASDIVWVWKLWVCVWAWMCRDFCKLHNDVFLIVCYQPHYDYVAERRK